MKKKHRPLRDEITDLPNLLTLARIATLPVVLVLIDNYSRRLSFAAALIFVVGGITDRRVPTPSQATATPFAC